MTGTPPDTGTPAANHDLLRIDDLTHEELLSILDRAERMKAGEAAGDLRRKTLGMLFQKPSTRTRVAFETGMTQLGGHAIFLSADDIHLGRGEPLKDTARTLSRYVDGLMVRVFDQQNLVEFAQYASVPVINGLTDQAHPCQALADLLTIRELFDEFDDVHAAWIGDSNNMSRSFILSCALAGVQLTVAHPEGYETSDDVLTRAAEIGTAPTITNDPRKAAVDADIVYTDVWISMGQEQTRHERLAAFEGFQINEELLSGTDVKVMHCLPAHRGEEITDAVLESDRSVVFEQAENRLHVQKALLVELLSD